MLQKVLIQELAELLFKGTFRMVHIDSRLVGPHDLFIAFPGKNCHGNAFIPQVLKKKGARVIAHREEDHPVDDRVHAVKDPEAFLTALAKTLRSMSRARFVAITGSNGKTTTKDLLHTVLGGGSRVLKTRGNLNNHLGVPLTLCQLKDHHDVAIIEAGTSGPGEIHALTSLIRPHISVLTSINKAHLSGLGSLKAIAQEKSDIFRAAPKAHCLVRAEDLVKHSSVREALQGREKVVFDLDVVGEKIEGISDGGAVSWTWEGRSYSLPTPAIHNVDNAMAALRVATHLGEDPQPWAQRLKGWSPSDHRLCLLNWKKRKILDDCYNANPASLTAATRTALQLKKRESQKVFVLLGDMKELGPRSKSMHRDCGKAMAEMGVDVLLTLGDHAAEAQRAFAEKGGEAFHRCESTETMANHIKALTRPHDILLIKGSRSMQLERVIQSLDKVLPFEKKAVG